DGPWPPPGAAGLVVVAPDGRRAGRLVRERLRREGRPVPGVLAADRRARLARPREGSAQTRAEGAREQGRHDDAWAEGHQMRQADSHGKILLPRLTSSGTRRAYFAGTPFGGGMRSRLTRTASAVASSGAAYST